MTARCTPTWLGLILLVVGFASGADWPQFRGPDGAGSSAETGLPVTWSTHENLIWRTELPGPGTSSPVTVGDRVFVTSYSGYGLSDEEPGEMDNLMRHVVCVDRKSGKILWSKEFKPQLPESKYSPGYDSLHGYASSTLATDGKRLYVFFGKSGVYALDLDGNEVWHADVGSKTTGWGTANSPILAGDLLIVNASIESGKLVALDKNTGKQDWEIPVGNGARNTPVLVDVPGGSPELVLSLPGGQGGRGRGPRPKPAAKDGDKAAAPAEEEKPKVETLVGLDPQTGEKLWWCLNTPQSGYVCPSVIARDSIVYAIYGRSNFALAVKAGGRGDITDSHVLWTASKGANIVSPVYANGHLFWLPESQGALICLNAKTGETMFQQRLDPRPGQVFSSLLAADGKLYGVTRESQTFVFAALPEFKQLAANTFEDDTSRANASPAVSDGKLLLRNDKYLYCLGSK